MSTYKSKFTSLPTAEQLRALAFPNGRPESFPFQVSQDINSYERQYLGLILRCLDEGVPKPTRPGQYTLSLNDAQMVIDISGGAIPMLSTKYVPYNSWIVETLGFIYGSTDVAFLKQHNVGIWDEWVIPETAVFEPADKYVAAEMVNWVRCKVGPEAYANWRIYQRDNVAGRPNAEQVHTWWAEYTGSGQPIPQVRLVSGSIGKGSYGAMWRARKHTEFIPLEEAVYYETKINPNYSRRQAVVDGSGFFYTTVYDQLMNCIAQLHRDPDGRRIIMDSWDPGTVKDCALPPCHPWVQFTSHVNEQGERELTLNLTMRSNDALLGNPFNIGQYAAVAHMVALVTGHKATKLVFGCGDFHIYEDQLPLVLEQLNRIPRNIQATMAINLPEGGAIYDLKPEDLTISGYSKDMVHPSIPYPIAV